jgi:hypothetical protein
MKLLDTLKKHKGTIAAFGAVFGAFATAYYAHKDTVEEIKADEPKPEATKEKVVYFGKHYWRTGLALGFTVGNIVISDRSHVKTIAGLAGGVALYAQQNEEIMDAVKDVFGQEGVEKIDKSIIQKHADKLPEYESEKKHKTTGNSFIIYDPYAHAYLETSKERLFQAEMEINRTLHSTWLVAYRDLFKLLGKVVAYDKNAEWLEPDICYLGWCLENDTQDWNWSFTKDNCAWIRFVYGWDEVRQCSVITYEVGPEICFDDNGPLF